MLSFVRYVSKYYSSAAIKHRMKFGLSVSPRLVSSVSFFSSIPLRVNTLLQIENATSDLGNTLLPHYRIPVNDRDQNQSNLLNESSGNRIVHLGVGQFHRSHQAVYLDEFLKMTSTNRVSQDSQSSWSITGVGLIDADRKMQDILRRQDYLYTVITKGPDFNSPNKVPSPMSGSAESDSSNISTVRVVGSHTDYVLAPDDPGRVLNLLTCPNTQIVSLTVTEKGYCHNPTTNDLNLESPLIQHDIHMPDQPKTALGYLLTALTRIYINIHQIDTHGVYLSSHFSDQVSTSPFTIMSCDNLPGNGDLTRKLLLQLFEARLNFVTANDNETLHTVEGLGRWLQEQVCFPNSMVDRITPVTTDENIQQLADEFLLQDDWPVVAEGFTQWIIEDKFSRERPRWEDYQYTGIVPTFVPDVIPYEMAKLRLLNGGHTTLAYLAYLNGYRQTHTAMANKTVYSVVKGYMHEVLPSVPEIEGMDMNDYIETLLARFSNSCISDQITRLCQDGTNKMNSFLVPALQQLYLGVDSHASVSPASTAPPTKDISTPYSATAIACWCYYLTGLDPTGNPILIDDPQVEALQLDQKARNVLEHIREGFKTHDQRESSLRSLKEFMKASVGDQLAGCIPFRMQVYESLVQLVRQIEER